MTVLLLAATLICTGVAAYYTWQQWLTADDSERRQTRAYVFMRDIKLEKRNDDTYDIIPAWENTGNSQTINMIAYLNHLMFPAQPIPNTFMYADIKFDKNVPITLGPKAISNISFSKIRGSCANMFNNRDGIDNFFIWGYAEYNDVLTLDRHITRFCYIVDQIVFSDDRKSARLSYGLCREGNCSDKECPTPQKQIYTVKIPASCEKDQQNIK